MALANKFRGALAGALVGDCLGSYWELQSWKGTHDIGAVNDQISEQIAQTRTQKAPLISYTDDTALTFALAESLLECRGLNPQDMARRLTTMYFDDPRRGYGPSVSTVFYNLKTSEFADIHLPANKQFKGEGSCGNGSAMRISPCCLYGYKDSQKLIEVCKESSIITHSHISGVNGSLLQAMAIQLALQTKPGELDAVKFVDNLMEKIAPFELEKSEQNGHNKAADVTIEKICGQPSYKSKLLQVRAFLTQEGLPSAHHAQEILGHGVLAAEAVPCAIYAFLRLSGDTFKELVPFSISLGGDTDTIASMAGAIGGAYWGVESIPQEWLDCCEESSKALALADGLYDLVHDPK